MFFLFPAISNGRRHVLLAHAFGNEADLPIMNGNISPSRQFTNVVYMGCDYIAKRSPFREKDLPKIRKGHLLL